MDSTETADEYKSTYRVGCALLAKKAKRYLTPTMMKTAAASRVELRLIDLTQPLLAQGRFDAIVHKMRQDDAWEASLMEYLARYPSTRVIDRPDCVRLLQNRGTMLLPLLEGGGLLISKPAPCSCELEIATEQQQQQLRWQQDRQQQQQQRRLSDQGGQQQHAAARLETQQQQRRGRQQQQHHEPDIAVVRAPLQVEISEGMSEEAARATLAAAGLAPPLLCKPLWTDGREGSHGLAVLHDLDELGQLIRGDVATELKPPLVVQQFIEHGGVLFKVYVMGQQTVLTRRPSLSAPQLDTASGVQKLPRVSCASALARHKAAIAAAAASSAAAPATAAAAERAAAGDLGGSLQHEAAQVQAPVALHGSPACLTAAARTPPEWVTRAVAAALRVRLGVMLFNFDMIAPTTSPHSGEQEECGAGGGVSSSSMHDAAHASGSAPGVAAAAAGAEAAGASSSSQQLYYVVDINYFPGVDKLPGFEQRLVDFLRAACKGEPPLPRGGGRWRTCFAAGEAGGGGSDAAGGEGGEEAAAAAAGAEGGEAARAGGLGGCTAAGGGQVCVGGGEEAPARCNGEVAMQLDEDEVQQQQQEQQQHDWREKQQELDTLCK